MTTHNLIFFMKKKSSDSYNKNPPILGYCLTFVCSFPELVLCVFVLLLILPFQFSWTYKNYHKDPKFSDLANSADPD